MISVLQVMMQLGTDEAGAEIRAKMQSASLLSDMESFKVRDGRKPLNGRCVHAVAGQTKLKM